MIDAHHHFWNYDPVEYGWIDEEMRAIRRSYLPEDLKAEIDNAGIEAVVSVQARQTMEETDWLLNMADVHDFIHGVVGWVPLADREITRILDQYEHRSMLKAVRHVVQGEPGGFLDKEAFNHGIRALTGRDLAYDILVFEHQLEEAIRFIDRHPNQRFILDHLAKPRIRENSIQSWRRLIRQLAERDNITCKLSGMVTEADYNNWSEVQLQPYLETALEAFTPERLMFGSDWPVCLVATDYTAWVDLLRRFIEPLSNDEQTCILTSTAQKAYKL